MRFIALGNDTITWVQRSVGSTDAYGQEIYTETQTVIPQCSLQPASTTEKLGEQDIVVGLMKLYCPTGYAFQSVDRIICNGITYEIDGDPMPWNDFFGNPDHVELMLRRSEG